MRSFLKLLFSRLFSVPHRLQKRQQVFLCGTPFVRKYNMTRPPNPRTRIRNGKIEEELLRGDADMAIWGVRSLEKD